jgi:hypothetical protein
MVLTDPVYLAEPFITSTNYRYNPNILLEFYPCTIIDEGLTDRRVPHFLPGTNPYLTEWMEKDNIPADTPRGGPQTMYPEFKSKITKRTSNNN